MRRNSRDLFEVISKLSSAEKRAISRAAAASGGSRLSKYGLLLDEIAGMTEYDEETLQDWARQNDIHDLPGSKRYLYKLILDQMTKRFWNETTTGKLRTMIAHAETLFGRALYNQARTILDKARGLAERAENLEALIQIENIEIRLQMHTGSPELGSEASVKGFDVLLEVIDRLKHVTELEQLANRMYILEMDAGRIRDGEAQRQARMLMQSQVLQRPANRDSAFAQLEWHDLHLRYYRMQSNTARTYFHSYAKVKVLQDNPAFADDNKHRCIFAYGHYLMECVKSGRWAEYDHYRSQLFSLKSRYPGRVHTVNEMAIYTEIWAAIHRAQPQELARTIESAGTCLQQDCETLELSSHFGILYGMVYGAIMLEEYRAALDWAGKMLNHPQLDQLGDIAVYVRLLNLLLHYELGNSEVLEHQLRAVYRFLQGRKRMYQVETALLRFIRRLPRLVNSTELVELFRALRQELSALGSDPHERAAMDYFAFDAWLSSKIEGRKFIDVWREERQEVWQQVKCEELVAEG